MLNDSLFLRGEKARQRSAALARQLKALQDLRTLENDYRVITTMLARTMNIMIPRPNSEAGVQQLLWEAEELLTTAPPPGLAFPN